MVSYNFMGRFVGPIRAGTKQQTIRRVGLRVHARPGEKLQLYTGMRTSECQLIGQAKCCLYLSLILNPKRMLISLGSSEEEVSDTFAKMDGFADPGEMQRFWLQVHGPETFAGVLIRWHELELATAKQCDEKTHPG